LGHIQLAATIDVAIFVDQKHHRIVAALFGLLHAFNRFSLEAVAFPTGDVTTHVTDGSQVALQVLAHNSANERPQGRK